MGRCVLKRWFFGVGVSRRSLDRARDRYVSLRELIGPLREPVVSHPTERSVARPAARVALIVFAFISMKSGVIGAICFE